MSNRRLEMIQERLYQAFPDCELTVADESHLHAGHAGAKSGKGHFALQIVAPQFAGRNMIDSHRLIYAALGELMETDIHALRIDARAPQESESG